jgi:hypothetical protein
MIITGNYTLQANPNWKQLQLQEIYLECDTTLTAVNITLPEIASMGGFFNVKIYVSDFANNAATNNINILVSGSDTIDATSSVSINTSGGSAIIAITSITQWICLESNAGGGGGGGLITVTKAALDALILSNSLVRGSFYRVKGVDVPLYGGTDIIVQAVSDNQITEDGTGFFCNPKYLTYGVYNPYVVVDITNTTGQFDFNETFTSDNGTTGIIFGTCVAPSRAFLLTNNIIGITSSLQITGTTSGEIADILIFSVPPYGTNSKAIWGGYVWENTSNDLGQIVDIYNLSPADWDKITFNTTDYNYVADAIKYDYANDLIIYRCEADADNSVLATAIDNLALSSQVGTAVYAIKAFQWGRNLDLLTFLGNTGNKVENSYFECINFDAQNIFNNLTQLSSVYLITTIEEPVFSYNTINNNTSFYNSWLIDNASFRFNNICNNCNVFGLTLQISAFSDNIVDLSTIQNVNFYLSDLRANSLNNSSIDGLTCYASQFNSNDLFFSDALSNILNGSGIANNTLSNSQIMTNTLDGTQIIVNYLEQNSTISLNTFSGSTIVNNKLINSTLSENTTSGGGTAIQGNLLSIGSSIFQNTLVGASQINQNILESYSQIDTNSFNAVLITQNNLSVNSTINSNNFENIGLGNNILNIGCTINSCIKTGSGVANIVNNTLDNFSYIVFDIIGASVIGLNSLSRGSFINESSTPQTINMQQNILKNQSYITDNNYVAGVIAGNELYSLSCIQLNTLNGGVIGSVSLNNNSIIQNNTINLNGVISAVSLNNSSRIQNSTVNASGSIGSKISLDASSIENFTIGSNTIFREYILQNSTLSGWNIPAASGISPACVFINNIVVNLLVAFPAAGTYIGLPEFANNAAALAGGLAATGLYRVTGTGDVQIVT